MRVKGQGAGLAPLLIVSAGILWGCMGLFVRRLNALALVMTFGGCVLVTGIVTERG